MRALLPLLPFLAFLPCAAARHSGLAAWDAAGRELAAQRASSPRGVVLREQDAHALYPITINPGDLASKQIPGDRTLPREPACAMQVPGVTTRSR